MRTAFQKRCDAAWRDNRYYAYTISHAVMVNMGPLEDGPTTNIYVIRDTVSDAIEIGVAVKPLARVATLQVGTPNELELVDWAPATTQLEKLMHSFLEGHRIRGEWFRAHPETLVACELIMSGGDIRRQYDEQGEKADPGDTFCVIAAAAEEAHSLAAAA